MDTEVSPQKISLTRSVLEDLKREFIALDLETTGLDSFKDRIVEIGAVRFINGRAKEAFSTLVHPNMSIPPQASRINGITNEMVSNAPSETEAISKLVEFIGDALHGKTVMCAHNASFDFNFLRRALSRSHFNSKIVYVDTLAASRSVIKGLDNYKQDTVLKHFNLSNLQAHRAQADALCCGKIMCKLFSLLDAYTTENDEWIVKNSSKLTSFHSFPDESEFDNELARPGKGKSIIDFPKDYCVIDIETSGYSMTLHSIIEVAALKFQNGKLVDTFSSLIKPDGFDSKNSFLSKSIREHTGITDEMLSTASDTKSVLFRYMNFIGNSILVGHNVHYDINFLYDNIEHCFNLVLSNDFVDTLRLSRRHLPNLPHHSLSDLVDHYGCKRLTFHRSLSDAQMTAQCYSKLVEDILTTYGSLEEFRKTFKRKSKPHYHVKAQDVTATSNDFDVSHPLYGKVCVFTGAFEKMTRKEAMQTLANLGGLNADNVTRKTNYLIVGNSDYRKSIAGNKSGKHKRAEQLKLDGYGIEIISENVFYDMI